jgi:hypothetical protein
LARSASLKSRGTWGVNAARGGTRNPEGSSTCVPFHRISPASRGSSPSTACNSVVFPLPMRPVTTVNDPRSRDSDTSTTPRALLGWTQVRPTTSSRSSRSAAGGGDTGGSGPRTWIGAGATMASRDSPGMSACRRLIDTRVRFSSVSTRPISAGRYVS